MSLTALDAELKVIIAEFKKGLDGLATASPPLSRTTLGDARAKVLKSFDDLEARIAPEVGQTNAAEPDVTDHPHFTTT